jgi:hypothetical protein
MELRDRDPKVFMPTSFAHLLAAIGGANEDPGALEPDAACEGPIIIKHSPESRSVTKHQVS